MADQLVKRPTKSDISKRFNEAQSRLVIQTADLPLATLAQMVDAKSIDLQPSFQRRERWTHDVQSALIESFLLNVPVPPIYLAEEPSGEYIAIDGKQRLRAIADFLGNRLSLRNLAKMVEAESLRFDDMPEDIKNAFKLRPYIRVVTLLKQTDKNLKYEVFLRLNRGGERLNAQEIRNVAFRGKLLTEVASLARAPFLRSQLKIRNDSAQAYRKMDDAEYVLRFLTLHHRTKKFSGDLRKEMDIFAELHQNGTPEQINALKTLFNLALDRCEAIWGVNAFKRPEKAGWRDQFLAGMYDAQMVSVVQLNGDQFEVAKQNKAKILERTRKLFEDEDFEQSVRAGTNTPSRLDYRISETLKALKSVNV